MKEITTIIENIKECWPYLKENSLTTILLIFLIVFTTFVIVSKIYTIKLTNLRDEKKNLEERIGVDSPLKKDLTFEELKMRTTSLIYEVSNMISTIDSETNKITDSLREKGRKIFLERTATGIPPIKANDDPEIQKLREQERKMYELNSQLISSNFHKNFNSTAYFLYKHLLKFDTSAKVTIKPYFENYFYLGDKWSIENILKVLNDLSGNNFVDSTYRINPEIKNVPKSNNTSTNKFLFVTKYFYLPFLLLMIGLILFIFNRKTSNLESSISKLKTTLHYQPKFSNKFFILSKTDLKKNVDIILNDLYQFQIRWEKSENQISELDRGRRSLPTDDYLKWLQSDYKDMRISNYTKYLEEYEKYFKDDAINIKEALLKKLNKSSADEILKNEHNYVLSPRSDTFIKNKIYDIYRKPQLPNDINIITFDISALCEEL